MNNQYTPRRDSLLGDIPMAEDPETIWVENEGLPEQFSKLMKWAAIAYIAIYVTTEYARASFEGLAALAAAAFLTVGWLR